MDNNNLLRSLFGVISKIFSKHIIGLCGLLIIGTMYIIVANVVASTKYTLIDLNDFNVVADILYSTESGNVENLISLSTFQYAEGSSAHVYLTDSLGHDLIKKVDLSKWDKAELWSTTEGVDIQAINHEDSVAFNLPVNDTHYYIYTFDGNFKTPPAIKNYELKKLGLCKSLELMIEYSLQKKIDSLIVYFQQYNGKERIDSASWEVTSDEGIHTYARSVKLLPDAKSFRIYLRAVNKNADSKIYLKTLELLNVPDAIITDIENNFKKLSFKLQLPELLKNPGYIGFTKELNLKGSRDFENLYYFLSAESDNVDLENLPFIDVKLFLNDVLVSTIPISEIGNPSFIEESLKLPDNMVVDSMYFYVGADKISPEQKLLIKEGNIKIKLEYLDIQ